PQQSLPAAGQGALGIEILESRSDMRTWLAPLGDAAATACTLAERAVSRVLGGSCQVPLAAFARLDGDTIEVDALVAEPDGSRILRAHAAGPASQAEQLGERAAQDLLDKGASAI